MAGFEEALESGRFLITTEETPPKGTQLERFFARTHRLRGVVDAICLTESTGAAMAMSPSGVVPGLIAQGHAPVLQITCRDRNRIALQGELLAAAALGVRTVVCMAGDPIAGGDHPDATEVNDLDTPGLLRTAVALNDGQDMAGNALNHAPQLVAGAVINPGAEDIEAELAWMERKADAGARFFLTQAVYNPDAFARFMGRAGRLGVPVLAGYIVPKSAEMVRRMNSEVPGVHIPDTMIERLESADNRAECAIELSAPILRRLATVAQGLHVIAVGWEGRLAGLLAAAGVERDPD